MAAGGNQRKPTGNWRSAHRSRSHDTAHAEAVPVSEVLKHPMVPRGHATLVDAQPQLEQLIEQLRAAGSFAYDSEFIGELTYVPKLCLIQVASSQQIALIDPLAGLDLKPFWELIADGSVEKIVHAGDQDLEPIIRELGREPANVFDTQIASGFVGMVYPVSLTKLVQDVTGVKLGKGLTLTHWDQRPLSTMQLRYAADDVRYLPATRNELGRRLEASGHAAWAKEECRHLCDASLYALDAEAQAQRIRGASSLTPRGLAVLRELVIWRDQAAKAHDVPPRSLVRDEVLSDMARSPVDSVAKLDRIRGLPRPVEQAHGAAIVEVTRKAMALAEVDLPMPRQTEDSPAERFRADALWAAAQCLCIGQSIDPGLVTSRQEIGEFYRSLTTGKTPRSRLLTGWRRDAVGEPLTKLMRGECRLNVDWADGSLRTQIG